ncbi:uncharacterized protein N7477_008548 [Penicillium maclennaniae]|uniref:uncharacterized protein n=1 Tax=Penicillium maclennaniae TaxID=1343394 RepID=UPI0025420551|nr:uncharacterized protein N7477_008548 [Penicillium maclennaniae]KAJ5666100.1 hypothetical protein N7477_008548 [Penicillium maclennaniae]
MDKARSGDQIEFIRSDGGIPKSPVPKIDSPKDILIRTHAASINPIDVKKASGASKLVFKDSFPYKIGYDCAGVVEEVGSDVIRFQAGDEVFEHGASMPSLQKTVAPKPAGLSMEDAASIPLAAMTALQALRRYQGTLEGKTVFVPAGLSGTGLFACQLAKNVFKAGKVITTVSTTKIPKVDELLGHGVVDETQWPISPLMRPETGTIVTISILTSGDVLQNSSLMRLSPDPRDKATVPFPLRCSLNVLDRVRVLRASRWKVKYFSIFLEPNAKDLEMVKGWVENGKVRTVVGTRAHYKDVGAVRDACQKVFNGKGGIGKAVIVFD